MTLDRAWDKFSGGPDRRKESLHVTINPKGTIYMNAKVYQALGRPKAVALYYNREADSIAIEPAYPRFVENFPLHDWGTGKLIRAATFCRHYRIRIPETQRFVHPVIREEGQLILNLRETVTAANLRRREMKPNSPGDSAAGWPR